ncbi:MAG TPA: TRAP transporter TatT component family protein [Vicinamibacterales bacterium]|nr:TRAP transporter TatT component family protein [Vicinamibacterales bacterium]
MAVKTVANTLSDTGDVFTRDDDPELIRDATPFALKLYESLLESVPTHVPLLVTTCGGFTQYGYAFLEAEADGLSGSRRAEAVALRERALKHYLRARGYCLRAIDSRFGKGTSEALLQDPTAAVAKARKDDVPLLYWSAAAWGAAISLGIDRPDLAIDLPTVRALADRALALDASWNKGAIHELMISLDSLPDALGGNPDRAREHFKTAVEIQKGLSPGPYVSLATGIAVPAQDRAEFERLLKDALAIDPEKDPSNRLVILITQRRARVLLDRVDELFSK